MLAANEASPQRAAQSAMGCLVLFHSLTVIHPVPAFSRGDVLCGGSILALHHLPDERPERLEIRVPLHWTGPTVLIWPDRSTPLSPGSYPVRFQLELVAQLDPFWEFVIQVVARVLVATWFSSCFLLWFRINALARWI